jgi:hypothetical protein
MCFWPSKEDACSIASTSHQLHSGTAQGRRELAAPDRLPFFLRASSYCSAVLLGLRTELLQESRKAQKVGRYVGIQFLQQEGHVVCDKLQLSFNSSRIQLSGNCMAVTFWGPIVPSSGQL